MSKEIEEALTRMSDLYCAICPHKKGDCNECEYNQKSNIVYQALLELRNIKSAEPSEALETFKIIKFKTINAGYDYGYKCWDEIEQALLKAQQLEKLIAELCEYYGFDNLYPYDDIAEIEATFKDTLDNYSLKRMKSISDLQKAEKLEKAWGIVKKKNVDIVAIKFYTFNRNYENKIALKMYNSNVNKEQELTEEEFDLLKEMTK